MFRHILIATDGSPLAEQAAAHGINLGKVFNAKVTAVMVTKPWAKVIGAETAEAFPYEDYERAAANEAKTTLATIAEMAKNAETTCATAHVKDQYPAEGIVSACKDLGCDLIVMGSHGRRGLAKLFLGSEASRVLAMSTVPVLICR